MHSLSKLLGLSVSFAALSNGFANPGACSGNCLVHDPAVFQRESDGVFFRFSTGNEI